MQTSIYDLLYYGDSHHKQMWTGLDAYRRRRYGKGLQEPQQFFRPIVLNFQTETLEEIGEILARAPASPASLRGEE